ncbi:MAG TPA: hypothetical protein VF762_03435 [Blastocatellia bacterium]
MTGRGTTLTADLTRIKYELELFMLGGAFDLYEDKQFVASVELNRAAADVSYAKLIFSCWGEGWSRSWRVIGCEATTEYLRLRCTKRMGRDSCSLELTRGQVPGDAALTRADFTYKLVRIIESNFPTMRVERAIAARHDPHHLSGVHSRLIINDRGKAIAGIGVGERESQSNIDAALGAGIIWLDVLRRKNASINRLMVFAPRDRAATIATRLTAVKPRGASISLYEVDESEFIAHPVAAFDQGDLNDHLRLAAAHAHWPRERPLSSEVNAIVDSIRRLSPGSVESHRRGPWVMLSIRGLEFARVSIARNRVEFGRGELKERLCSGNQSRLAELVSEITAKRNADSDHLNDTVFRAQTERWLESIIRRDVSVIDPSLDPRYAYSQVPAYRGEQRSFIDLLAATRDGRLVVIELKVAEDPEFPFQGLDYWLRVEWHLRRGDFQRRGYFGGLKLADAAPLLYLVAPLFRFHATIGLVAGSIRERVPVYRVGINEDWRAGARPLLNERLNEISGTRVQDSGKEWD